ncbi:MAG TPA: hypothetical protein DIS66_00500 [Candidatus Omnitrophica bacterium]|nr:hypothetical protein [Candidatus Omnitrophota bacterium]
MLDDEPDFLPPKPEEIPDRLARKWEERETKESLVVCRNCGKQVLASSSVCAYCGGRLSNGKKPFWVMVAAAVLILFSILFFLRRWV